MTNASSRQGFARWTASAIVLFAASLSGGCGDSVIAGDRLTPAELAAALTAKTAVALDVRSKISYDLGHIEGAIHIPLGEVAARASELPTDKRIVTYCS